MTKEGWKTENSDPGKMHPTWAFFIFSEIFHHSSGFIVENGLSCVRGCTVTGDVGCGMGCGDWFDMQPAEPMINNISNTIAQEPFGIMV